MEMCASKCHTVVGFETIEFLQGIFLKKKKHLWKQAQVTFMAHTY